MAVKAASKHRYADVTPLPSQDTSPFSINVYYQDNDMNHDVMLPGGTP
jgi:hypothetical protein